MTRSQRDSSGPLPPLGIILPALMLAGCTPGLPEPSIQPPPSVLSIRPIRGSACLIASPSINLGVLNPGEAAQAMLRLRNPNAESVALARLETSCPCVRVTPQSAWIRPGESDSLEVAFDPTHDPEFRGELGVNVTGFGAGGIALFRTVIKLDVRSTPPPVPGREIASRPSCPQEASR